MWQLPRKISRCGCYLRRDWWRSLQILMKIVQWGDVGVPYLHSTKVLAEPNPWEVRAIAPVQIRLRGHTKLCVIDTCDRVKRDGLSACRNHASMLLGEIRSLKTNLLGPMPEFIVLRQHVPGKYADQVIYPPVALPLKPDGFQYMMISI
jgi:hypothetical protein